MNVSHTCFSLPCLALCFFSRHSARQDPKRNSSLRQALLAGAAIGLLLAPLPLAAEDFIGYERSPISTSVADWGTDRTAPSDFRNVGTFQGRENVLRLSSRPPARGGRLLWEIRGENPKSIRPPRTVTSARGFVGSRELADERGKQIHSYRHLVLDHARSPRGQRPVQ